VLAHRAALPAIATLAVACWLLGPLGIAPVLALRALLVLALAIAPWGLLLVRGIAAAQLFPSERLLLALLVGYPVASALAYLSFILGRPMLFLAASLGAAAVALLRPSGSAPAGHGPSDSAARPHWSLALFVPLALVLATRWSQPFVAVAGGLQYPHSVDHSLHLAFYWELLRGVPAEQLPTAAGVPFPAYHFLAYMPGLLLVSAAGAPVADAYHVLSPLAKLLLLCGAACLAVRLRTGDARAAAATLPALFVAGYAFEVRFNDRFVVGPAPHYDLVRNEAEGGGLVIWATVLCLLALADRLRREGQDASRPLLLACLLAGLSFGFKAQLFVLFGPALVVALLIGGGWRPALRGGIVIAAVCGLLFWLAHKPGSPATTVGWRPGLFAELYVFPYLRRDPWAWVRQLGAALEALPAPLDGAAATLLAWLRIGLFSPLVPAFVWHALRRPRGLGYPDALAAAALLLALPMAYGLSFAFLHWPSSPFEFRQSAHGLSLLAVILSVVALFEALRPRVRDAGGSVLAAALLLSLLGAPALVVEERYLPARASIVLSPDEQCALLYLRRHTPERAVVLASRAGTGRANHHSVVGGFAGRRAVLELYEGWEVDPDNDRARDVRRFFTTGDAALAGRILARYRVDYVLESDQLPLRSSPTGLSPVFERGGFRVWRVGGTPAAPAPPQPAFLRDDALRCGALP
jgi:hypothetical protein